MIVYAGLLAAVWSSTPVTVTVCGVSQSAAVNVRLDGRTVASPGWLLATATVTVPAVAPARRTVNESVIIAPPSRVVTAVFDRVRAAAAVSSFSMVSSAPVTAPTPCVFSAVPVTVTTWSRWTMLLSTALMVAERSVVVAASVLRVSPASMVSVVRFRLVPAGAVSVTVVASLDGWLSAAVTVVCVSLAVPLDSLIEEAASASVTVGASSSSVMVSVLPRSADCLAQVIRTGTSRSGASTLLGTAVMVTDCSAAAAASALSVSPASTVSVFAAGTVYTPDTAFTSQEIAAGDARTSWIDTALVPPFSAIVRGDSCTLTSGTSLSVSVPVTVALGRASYLASSLLGSSVIVNGWLPSSTPSSVLLSSTFCGSFHANT